MDIAHELLSLRLGADIGLLIVVLSLYISVEFDFEFRGSWSWVLIDGLEAMIWHLVGLDSDVDITTLL